ncbi:Forkhead Box Protein O1 [Manis pentadactyla]|nr:Forkhead Box Protein O1 [Manis pentadactyla]
MLDPRCPRLCLPPGTNVLAALTSLPSLGSPLRACWAPGAALAPSLLSSGGRKAAIDLDLKLLPRSDVSHYSSATSSLAPWGSATRNPDAAAGLPSASVATEGQPRKSSSSGHSAWCNLSHADRIAESIEIESSAEKRLTLPQIYGGWSRAGPS